MGLALRIEEVWPRPPEDAPTPSPGATSELGLKALLETFADHVRRFEEYVDRTEASRTTLVASARSLGDSDALSSIESAIEEFRRMEQELADAWLPQMRRAEADRKKALRSRHPLRRGPYADLLRRRSEAMASALENLRDVRLDLAVIATELDEEPASPAFDDPVALKKYLETV